MGQSHASQTSRKLDPISIAVNEKDALFQTQIEKALEISNNNKNKTFNEKSQHVEHMDEKMYLIFDTDIGSDIDDSIALLALLNLPRDNFELVGITTTYGYTEIRTQVTKKILEAHLHDTGSPMCPIITGSNCSLHPNAVLPAWHAKTEGIGVLTNEEIIECKTKSNPFVSREELEKKENLDAARFIIDKSIEYNGKLTVLVLGGMINVARALQLDPDIASRLNKVVFMGASVVPPKSPVPDIFEHGVEYLSVSGHNMRQDQYSANLVFQSGIKVFCVGSNVTRDMWFENTTVEKMRSCSWHHSINPYANEDIRLEWKQDIPRATQVVGTLFDVWLKHRCYVFGNEVKGTCPHDALTTFEAIYPHKFVKYVCGHLILNENPYDREGKTCFVYDPIGGNVCVAIGWNVSIKDFEDVLEKAMMNKLTREDLFPVLGDLN